MPTPSWEVKAANVRSRSPIHYHVIDNKVGDPRQYRDDVFPSRRRAEAVARARAEWLAAMAGLRVEALTGSGHYLITGWHSLDGARTLEVEECEDGACLGIAYDSMY